jgi:hypothetical protein
MTPPWSHAADLLHGPLLDRALWPLMLCVLLCDLRPRFLPKGRAGRGHRAVARNGRVLLASDVPVTALTGRPALVRLQTWHRALLPSDRPKAHGLLLCVRDAGDAVPQHGTRLVRVPEEPFELAVEVGGGLVLEFRRMETASGTA